MSSDDTRAAHLFCDATVPEQAISRFFASVTEHARAQAELYGLRRAHGSIGRYFALHGGGGNGRDFLWVWLREARSRGALLLAPSSQGSTWSFLGPDVDALRLRSLIDWLAERWRIDRSRVLLTGLSDGATYALLCGLSADSPFTALAPGAGVLHPANLANGNLERARAMPIYLMHGARDWMFPVALARGARSLLERVGARLVYREIADLAHAWPREENARILDWFGELHMPPAA